MRDVPFNARVECTDGLAGHSSYVIINPTTKQVTHYVVKENGRHHTERLVPIDWVVETAPGLIRLRCSREKLAALESFTQIQHLRDERPRYDQACNILEPPIVPKETILIPVKHKRIPLGELAMHRGTQVRATDGLVGWVEELLVDPVDQYITHLVLRKGRLWNKEDVTIPVSAICCVKANTICLNLDKHTVGSLPANPVK